MLVKAFLFLGEGTHFTPDSCDNTRVIWAKHIRSLRLQTGIPFWLEENTANDMIDTGPIVNFNPFNNCQEIPMIHIDSPSLPLHVPSNSTTSCDTSGTMVICGGGHIQVFSSSYGLKKIGCSMGYKALEKFTAALVDPFRGSNQFGTTPNPSTLQRKTTKGAEDQ